MIELFNFETDSMEEGARWENYFTQFVTVINCQIEDIMRKGKIQFLSTFQDGKNNEEKKERDLFAFVFHPV